MGAQRKREREKEINKLTDKILKLEAKHKQYLTTQSTIDLLGTRKPSQQTLEPNASYFLGRKCIMNNVNGTRQANFWQGP